MIPRCQVHGLIPRYGCHPCDVMRWAYKNEDVPPRKQYVPPTAQNPTVGTLRDGDTYLVWLKGEGRAMMARLYRDNGVVRLQPINRTLPPVFKKPGGVEIGGRVLKTIRVYYPVGNWPTG